MLYKNPLNKKIFLTIDFEDLYFDYKRSLKIKENKEFKEKALWESYQFISTRLELIKKNLKITFFCTGILAKQFPDLIKRISRDGHEIACHYFYHDYANKDKINNFNLPNITCLEDVYDIGVICDVKAIKDEKNVFMPYFLNIFPR